MKKPQPKRIDGRPLTVESDQEHREAESGELALSPRESCGPWYCTPVTRTDAGGRLYAPANAGGQESGHTPSYDADGIQRLCTTLNERKFAVRQL